MEKYLTVEQCMNYLHMTRPSVMKFCGEAKALFRMGRRVLIDKRVLDAHIKKVRTEQNG